MGLSASQMRYLSLTARQSNLEYEAQMINSERVNLANKSADAQKAYTEGMNNKVIRIGHWETGMDGRSQKVWNELTFESGMAQGYYIVGANGSPLVPSPYKTFKAGDSISVDAYWNMPESKRKNLCFPIYNLTNDIPFCTAGQTITPEEYGVLFQSHADLFTPVKDNENNIVSYRATQDIVWEKEASWISEEQRTMLMNRGVAESNFEQRNPVQIGVKAPFTYTDPDYNGMDIQQLLVSGRGQIVSESFYKFLCDHGYGSGKFYNVNEDGSKTETTYAQLVEDFETDVLNTGIKTVVDWRADEKSVFKEDLYTEDDAVVLADWEATTAEIQHQDKLLELQLKRIETERNAIQTEMEAVKKVIEKNIENTYKTFG